LAALLVNLANEFDLLVSPFLMDRMRLLKLFTAGNLAVSEPVLQELETFLGSLKGLLVADNRLTVLETYFTARNENRLSTKSTIK
jgi:predicted proteasome-type protease